MSASDTYLSIEDRATGVFKDSGSRFIAHAFPVETEEEVKALLSDIRKEYHDARHHCCAYRIGMDGSLWRAGDDGEPSGSAGRPILSQIDSRGLSDVAVIVVRYFGGIKLGIPGLVRAYKSATEAALSSAKVIEKTAGEWVKLSFPYSSMPEVMRLIKEMALPRREVHFENECSLETFVRLTNQKEFFAEIEKIDIFKC